MKSIKPGRGPSMMGGVMGIFVALFGVFWTIMAATMGGGFIVIFGVIFVIIAVVQTVYHFKNATGENRYSEFDIVDGCEEPDPFHERFGRQDQGTDRNWQEQSRSQTSGADGDYGFCPYCGTRVEGSYSYCPKCGKKLPYNEY